MTTMKIYTAKILREAGLSNRSEPVVAAQSENRGDLRAFVEEESVFIKDQLCEHGALLFRDSGVDSVKEFQNVACAISSDIPDFAEESSPRSVVDGKVMTSTNYPADYPIQFHNEYSYAHSWPMRLYFYCLQPAAQGGETPIADSRRVLSRLSPGTRERFLRLGVLYKRNYTNGIGVPWTTAFRTTDQAVVEETCRARGIQWKWRDDSWLETTQFAPAIIRHPITSEDTWFNHAFFFNVLALEPVELREYMLEEPEGDLSSNTYFGDGSRIPVETIEEIRAAYAAESVVFSWRRGDILLIDNMLVAHSRRPYSGDRKVVVVMGDACSRDECSREAAASNL
jgi:alpha-ketoglutarate-dependent taurine dioxygenase